MAAAILAGYGLAQASLNGGYVPASVAQHLAHRRPAEEHETDHGGDRVAWQGQQRNAADGAEGHRLPGLHIDPPEVYVPLSGKHVLDQIEIADRYSPGGDYHVGPQVQGALEPLCQGVLLVGSDLEHQWLPSGLCYLSRVAVAVDVAYLAGCQGSVDSYDLVPRGQHCHPGTTVHADALVSHGSQHAYLLRT